MMEIYRVQVRRAGKRQMKSHYRAVVIGGGVVGAVLGNVAAALVTCS